MNTASRVASAPRAAPTASRALRRIEPVVVEPLHPGIRRALREFWLYRGLVPYFGGRYLQKRFARTWLGMFWLPLRPGINLAMKILFFGGLIGISTGKTPYAIFFIVATAAWQLFYETSYWSLRSVELNRKVLARVPVPKLILVVAAIVPASVDFLVNISFAALAVAYYVVRADIFYLELGMRTLLVPAGLLLMILLGLGVGLITSGAGARTRDLRFAVGYFFSLLYFLTPVIYPITQIPEKARPIAELNPMTGAVEMVKDGLFQAHELSSDAVIVTVVWVILLCIPGLWLFDRREMGLVHGQRFFRRRASISSE